MKQLPKELYHYSDEYIKELDLRNYLIHPDLGVKPMGLWLRNDDEIK